MLFENTLDEDRSGCVEASELNPLVLGTIVYVDYHFNNLVLTDQIKTLALFISISNTAARPFCK